MNPSAGPRGSGDAEASLSTSRSERARRARRVWAHRARVVEASGLLAVGAAAQKWVPMVRWARVLGQHGSVPDDWQGQRIDVLPSRSSDPVEYHVAAAIRSSMAHVPGTPSCLAQAFAGQVMLRRRKRSGVVVIGLRPSTERADGRWDAHAWLLGHRGALTGGPAAQGFTATTVFEVPGGLRGSDVELSVQQG